MKNLKVFLYLLLGTVVLGLSACAPSNGGTPTQESGTSLLKAQWRLVSYGEAGLETPVIEETEVLLQFEDENQLAGYGGCNMFTAEYELMNG